jgi:predicted hydrocarbon binding protein
MFDFAKKLLFARKLSIEKGSLTILGHRYMMIPAKTFVDIVKNDKKAYKSVYIGSRDSGKEYSDYLIKEFHAKTAAQLEEVLINTFNLAGWGELEIIKNDMKNKFAIFHIKNSSMSTEYGKSSKPICHTNRGFLAGGASRVYKSNVECIEIKCRSVGNAFCEYIAADKKAISRKYPKLAKSQL